MNQQTKTQRDASTRERVGGGNFTCAESAGPRSLPKKQRRPGQERIRPDNLGALLVVAAWRGEEKGKAGVVLASGGGFLRPGARNRWKGSGRRAPLASLPARLFV